MIRNLHDGCQMSSVAPTLPVLAEREQVPSLGDPFERTELLRHCSTRSQLEASRSRLPTDSQSSTRSSTSSHCLRCWAWLPFSLHCPVEAGTRSSVLAIGLTQVLLECNASVFTTLSSQRVVSDPIRPEGSLSMGAHIAVSHWRSYTGDRTGKPKALLSYRRKISWAYRGIKLSTTALPCRKRARLFKPSHELKNLSPTFENFLSSYTNSQLNFHSLTPCYSTSSHLRSLP